MIIKIMIEFCHGKARFVDIEYVVTLATWVMLAI